MIQHSALSLPHDASGQVSLYHWQDTPSERPVLHWAHANGFNGRTYEPLLTPLADKFDLYAWDARGHGRTKLRAEPREMTGWDIYGRDLIGLAEHLADKHGKKIWLGGHSMGGCASVIAAAQRPDLVAGLILADPVITPRTGPLARLIMRVKKTGGTQLAEMAKKRRAIWPDRDTVTKAYTGRGAFASWGEGFLDAYLEGGLEAGDDGLHLACAPHWEAANFKGPQLDCKKFIRRLNVPFTLLTAEHGSTTYFRQPFEALALDKKIEIVAGTTHFLPMEVPDYLRAEIVARISKTSG